MSPYREDGAREPSDDLTPGERRAREDRAARRRAIMIAVGVPLTLLLVAGLVGVLLDLSSSKPPPAQTTAPTSLPSSLEEADVGAPARVPAWPSGTVTDYCYEGCPTYAEAWANVSAGREPPTWCVSANRAGPCNRVETGTCGARRYVKVEVDVLCGGSTRYFDEAGVMVGVVAFVPNHERADGGGYHDPVRERTYGHIPDCTLVPSESTCVKPVD